MFLSVFQSQLSRHFCVDQKPFQIDPHTKVAHTHRHTHGQVCMVWELAFKAAIKSKNTIPLGAQPKLQAACAFGFGFRFGFLFFLFLYFRKSFRFSVFMVFLGSPSVSVFLADTLCAYLCLCVCSLLFRTASRRQNEFFNLRMS